MFLIYWPIKQLIDNSILFTEKYRIERPTQMMIASYYHSIYFNKKACIRGSNPRGFSKVGFMFSYFSLLFFPEAEAILNALGSAVVSFV